MTVGERIKTCRQALGLSIDDLARTLDKNRATIYRYENNSIENLPISVLEPLAKALRTTPAYLMGWSTDPMTNVYDFIPERSISIDRLEELDNLYRKLQACTDQKEVSRIMRRIARIEKIRDRIFGFEDNQTPPPIPESELRILEKYRILDKHGKETVDWNLSHEYTRCATPKPAPTPAPLPGTVEEEERPLYNVTPVRRSLYKASAGTGTYLGPEAFEIIEVQENELTSRASFVVPVSGDSMEPLYSNGDVLIVENCEELEPGEIGVFTLNGEAYVKKLGKGQLISLNSAYDPIPMNESILLNGRVIGVLEPDWIVG